MTPRPDPRCSLEYSRTRDSRVCWLLDQHPVTAAMLVRLGLFPNRNKALRRLRRLVARGRVRLVGTVSRGGGRPEHVYCRWRPKADQLLHEVELTELCLRLDAESILRGPLVTVTGLRPDAEVWINGRLYHLELDRGTMSYAQVQLRFRLYEQSRHLVLWVCGSRSRAAGLRSRAAGLRRTALFSTLKEVLADPHGPVWADHGGETAALPRQRAGG